VQKKIFISSISVAELQYGVYHSQSVVRNRVALTEFLAPFDIMDFDSRAAEHYGMLREALSEKGKMIGPYDLLIASQALASDLTLVTNNQKEFRQIKQLRLEDWKK
jgi:tRNA(fMet)-specific endonuclease VapC